jgi:hypothetical protein
MKALDTNVLVRFLVKDDEQQAKSVYRLFKQAESKYILPRINPSLRQIRQRTNSNLPLAETLCPDLGGRAHLSSYTGRTSRIVAPFFRLKANCLNIRSIWFFIICVNRALQPLSSRWLMPKYCSTMCRMIAYISNNNN